ncbi:uncharacterized protein LOC110092130 [Dendrobium catenatum]|uniref:uncharacterized protein LOC110092130 n=1 Tax=Dendrobium catenatum TaxID=906689 RepID=UPI00109F0B1A|nr:uncharacterized protein LOC110092130 [Dendrobium catenatum]
MFLGIRITPVPSGHFLDQQQYAQAILQASGFLNCKPSPTPISLKPQTHKASTQPSHDPTLYRQLASSLQYLTITRLDVAFATNQICQHMHDPQPGDFQALKRLLSYIQGTITYGLPPLHTNLDLTTYVDVDWASDNTDQKSTTGFCTFLGSNLISWTLKKQNTVAKSSTEAEYRALAAATSDILWLRRLLREFDASQTQPTKIFCDNTSAIALAKNPIFHARTKHIEIDYHFISHHINNKEIKVLHINSIAQHADLLTKPLPTSRFQELRTKLTILARDNQFEGAVRIH